ncbi:hyaluronoglucosaminidase [Ancylostoma duodenale]|uniref:Hyaluronidase n=1 Tax=Ancylostoma duodenale TaxID=51022 RepID=A0A0C2GX79_9BILA|nr:hyaluronoglucosaminidase [Ancylostoma duodenale]
MKRTPGNGRVSGMLLSLARAPVPAMQWAHTLFGNKPERTPSAPERDLSFFGEKVAIFYEFGFGRYPYYKDYNASQPINGGLPQKCNLTAHLIVAEDNITKNIRNESFSGLAIIDLEEWRPLWDQNGYMTKQVV